MSGDDRAVGDRAGEEGGEGFGGLVGFTLAGYLGGLLAAVALDRLGQAGSGLGQALVRTLSGEGESVLEGAFALRQRWRHAAGTLAEAYGWGKLLGMAAPWLIDAASRLAGVDVNGVAGFYLPFFYALSDQIGALLAGYVHLRRRHGDAARAARAWLAHPVVRAGLAVVLVVPVGLAVGRLLGFSPTTQVRTALETIAANLCWVPPLVGWLGERRERRRGEAAPPR